jgi:DNA-3-methyladenine glycosylase
MTTDGWSILSGPSLEVAPRLLGSLLVRELDGQTLVGKIVETEAYDQSDPASHSFSGSNGRAAVTFGPAGHLYVYSIRHHFCCDVTTGAEGYGSSVLIRAVEPVEGIDVIRERRRGAPEAQLTNGPAKFCQAFGIDKSLNGHNLRQSPLQLILQPALSAEAIGQTTRIGITKAAEKPWRFYVKGSPFVTKST